MADENKKVIDLEALAAFKHVILERIDAKFLELGFSLNFATPEDVYGLFAEDPIA